MAGLAHVPLFPFQADGISPVPYMSLAGGRGLWPAWEVTQRCPPSLPAKACTWPSMFGREGALFPKLGFLPVPAFSSG